MTTSLSVLGTIQSEQTSWRLTIYLAALLHMLTPDRLKTTRNRSKPAVRSPPKSDLLPHYSKGWHWEKPPDDAEKREAGITFSEVWVLIDGSCGR